MKRPKGGRVARLSMAVLLGVGLTAAVLITMHYRRERRRYEEDLVRVQPSSAVAPQAIRPRRWTDAIDDTDVGIRDLGQARELMRNGLVPPVDALSVEAMWAEHDLAIEGSPTSHLLQLRASPAIASGPPMYGTWSAWLEVEITPNLPDKRFERPSLTLVACVDVSESMGWGTGSQDPSPRPARVARQLLQQVARQLGPRDHFALLTYDATGREALPFVRGDAHERITKAIDGLAPGGRADLNAGLSRAIVQAAEASFETDQTRVLLLTDEQPKVDAAGSTAFEMMVEDGAEQGVGLTVFELGAGIQVELARTMARTWGGNAYSLRTDQDVSNLMADCWPEMVSPIAHDLELRLHVPQGFRLDTAYGPPILADAKLPHVLDMATVFYSRRPLTMLFALAPIGVSVRDCRLSVDLSYKLNQGPGEQQNLEIDYAALPTGMWPAYGQPAVQKAIALAKLAAQMRTSSWLYRHGEGSLGTITQATEYFRRDTIGLYDESLGKALDLATKCDELNRAGGRHGELYGARPAPEPGS